MSEEGGAFENTAWRNWERDAEQRAEGQDSWQQDRAAGPREGRLQAALV